MENSPPGIHTMPAGAGPGGGSVLASPCDTQHTNSMTESIVFMGERPCTEIRSQR
jgi:hypothetical protein